MSEKNIEGWANQMAARFGHPVYLVGSALTQEKPRDYDVRIMIPDEEFVARYGPINDWLHNIWGTWEDAGYRWGNDMAKMNRQATIILQDNIDLQVFPKTWADAVYSGKPKKRLDSLDVI